MENKATIKVVLDIFSGEPNPRWVLSDAQVDELKAKISTPLPYWTLDKITHFPLDNGSNPCHISICAFGRSGLGERQCAVSQICPKSNPYSMPKKPPQLGYRGYLIRNVSKMPMIPEEILVYGGVLTIFDKQRTSSYKDLNQIEEWLISQTRKSGYDKLINEDWQYSHIVHKRFRS